METSGSFRFDDSLVFALQIPDDLVGCSGSRCSNCDGAVAYCNQMCRHCSIPLVGPFGLPQIIEWRDFSEEERQEIALRIFQEDGYGRLIWNGVSPIPLTPIEVGRFERLPSHEKTKVNMHHGLSPEDIKRMFKERNQ